MERFAVIGAGAWGTALAMVARRAGRSVILQAHEPEIAAAINKSHENPYLPDVAIDPAIEATADLGAAIDGIDAAILVAPAQFLRPVTQAMAAATKGPFRKPVLICAKGIENATCKLMTEVVAETLPGAPQAVLSGPTFAVEVARDIPSAVTLASDNAKLAQQFTQAIGTPRFRPYLSQDPIGAEVGGAVKNVLAIACGIVQGRGMGDNTRAALITRGLAEIVRLGLAKGAQAETLMGLCGIGDLTLTCNAMQSRNFSLGVALGRGRALKDILAERKAVTEGVFSARAVIELAGRLGVDMPICTAVNAIVNHGKDIDKVIEGLLARPFTKEL
ncbi:MAG: glycerol-3-phosphate acyltransferase [Rhodospirillales bacterium CG15_BIG_FIL_POST_REV_8_21_14_020_66_15]|nr:MAG: glycerol-3-phosphate acyltransferase [Rhodospirillales bacterium CG15_BIG_FIL_POST_REV_8_21_14_020_66_15]